MLRPPYPQEKSSGTHWIEGWQYSLETASEVKFLRAITFTTEAHNSIK